MAKISARGDREAQARRHHRRGANGVLTQRGRLLHKPLKGAGFNLLMSKTPRGHAEAQAAERGMERV